VKKSIFFLYFLLQIFSSVVLVAQSDNVTSYKEIVDSLRKEALLQQNKDSLLQNLPIMPEQVESRAFDTASIATYLNDEKYNYDRKEPKNQSFLEAILNKIAEWFIDMLATEQGRTNFRYFIYLFTAVMIVFAVAKLLNMDFTALFFMGAARKKSEMQATWLEEDIHEIDFNKEISQAVTTKSYRVAVRLFYLYTLKQLTDKKLIVWQLDKTNQEYVKEIAKNAPQLKQEFVEATYYFEYVWYGEFPVNAEQFEQAQALYQRFSSKV